MNPKPGEVWFVDLGIAGKMRPVVIVSRFDPNPPRALFLYVPLTTQNRSSQYEIEIPKISFLKKKSIANVQGLASLPISRLERKIGELPQKTLQDIKKALSFALDL